MPSQRRSGHRTISVADVRVRADLRSTRNICLYSEYTNLSTPAHCDVVDMVRLNGIRGFDASLVEWENGQRAQMGLKCVSNAHPM